jgi:hypothetical protein
MGREDEETSVKRVRAERLELPTCPGGYKKKAGK